MGNTAPGYVPILDHRAQTAGLDVQWEGEKITDTYKRKLQGATRDWWWQNLDIYLRFREEVTLYMYEDDHPLCTKPFPPTCQSEIGGLIKLVGVSDNGFSNLYGLLGGQHLIVEYYDGKYKIPRDEFTPEKFAQSRYPWIKPTELSNLPDQVWRQWNHRRTHKYQKWKTFFRVKVGEKYKYAENPKHLQIRAGNIADDESFKAGIPNLEYIEHPTCDMNLKGQYLFDRGTARAYSGWQRGWGTADGPYSIQYKNGGHGNYAKQQWRETYANKPFKRMIKFRWIASAKLPVGSVIQLSKECEEHKHVEKCWKGVVSSSASRGSIRVVWDATEEARIHEEDDLKNFKIVTPPFEKNDTVTQIPDNTTSTQHIIREGKVLDHTPNESGQIEVEWTDANGNVTSEMISPVHLKYEKVDEKDPSQLNNKLSLASDIRRRRLADAEFRCCA